MIQSDLPVTHVGLLTIKVYIRRGGGAVQQTEQSTAYMSRVYTNKQTIGFGKQDVMIFAAKSNGLLHVNSLRLQKGKDLLLEKK